MAWPTPRPSGPVTELGAVMNRHPHPGGELHMSVVTDAVICYKPDKRKPGIHGVCEDFDLGERGGLPGGSDFWMDYLRAALNEGVA